MPHRFSLRWTLATPLFVLASCAAPPKPVAAPPAPPPPIAPPVPVESADWRDWPVTPGTWVYAGGTARFGVAGAPPELELRCDAATRTVVLTRAAGAPATGRNATITTSDGVRSLAMTEGPGGPLASIAVRDPFLDRMAFSRGRIVVAVAGTARLVVPAWAEIGRVVEDCRA